MNIGVVVQIFERQAVITYLLIHSSTGSFKANVFVFKITHEVEIRH